MRRFFSHWNVFQCEWAASDWSDEVRAQILEARNSPQATRLAELMNGGSRAVHARRTASDLVAQGARPRY